MQFGELFDDSGWSTRFSIIALTVITVIVLAPFLNKAFNIDDTLFLFAAKHIHSHPFDPYGFNVTWYYSEMPMWEVTKNPPMACYFIALVTYFSGFSEVALHVAFLLPAIAAIVGTYFLAKHFCRRPIIAALIGALTPAFLVSSSSVMCDVMMLAFWVWAILLWLRGIEKNNHVLLLGSAFLIAASALTKYYGMVLIGFLPLYAFFKKRKIGIWVLYLAIPVMILALYQHKTNTLYGVGLLSDASKYATQFRERIKPDQFIKFIIGLGFMGGSVMAALFYLPFLYRRKILIAQAALFISAILFISFIKEIGLLQPIQSAARPLINIHLGIFAAIGINILILVYLDFWDDKRSAESILLALWIIGAFIFASFINWSINVRSILPMVPAVGILLARRMEKMGVDIKSKRVWWPLLPAAIVALLVTQADSGLANSARAAASEVCSKYSDAPGNLWYQGHWGFQYYMDRNGANIARRKHMEINPGDLLVVPENNCYTFPMPIEMLMVNVKETMAVSSPRWGATMNRYSGAGFYADVWGPLPFIFGHVPRERYNILEIAHSDINKDDETYAFFSLKHPDVFNEAYYTLRNNLMFKALGKEYLDKSRYGEAISCYTQALIIYPYDVEALNGRGNAYILVGDFEKGIADQSRALEINPYFLKAYSDRATAYICEDKYKEALSDYGKALKIDPSYAKARRRFDAISEGNGKFLKTILESTKLIQKNPNDIEALMRRADAYIVMESYDNAIADYAKAIALDTNLIKAYHNRAVAYFKKKEYQKAWEDVRKVESLGGQLNQKFLDNLSEKYGRERAE